MSGTSTSAPHSGHAVGVAGCFAFMAVALSFHQIYGHLRHYTAPQYQKYIVRIIGMVPVYSMEAFMSLVWSDSQHFFQALRDSYEAYVIYTFFSLLIEYLEGEQRIVHILESHERMKHPWPFHHWKPVALNSLFLRRCKQGTLQFVFVKPFMAVLAFILARNGKYDEGQLRLDGGYFWISFITNVSITLALYGLIYFYLAVSQELTPFKPLPKYLCIKSVVFFSYWQSVGFMFLVHVGLVPDIDSAVFLQNLIICIEMFFAAIAYRFAFSFDFGNKQSQRPPLLSNIKDVMSIHDVLSDAHETFINEKVSSNKIEMRPYQEPPTDDIHLGSESRTLKAIQKRHNKEYYAGLGKDLEEDITDMGGPSAEGGYASCDEDLTLVTEEELHREQTRIQTGMIAKPSNYELEDNLSDQGLEDAMQEEGLSPAGTADLAAAFLASEDQSGDITSSTLNDMTATEGDAALGGLGTEGSKPEATPAEAAPVEPVAAQSALDTTEIDDDDPFSMFQSPSATTADSQVPDVTPTPVRNERDEMFAYMATLETPQQVPQTDGTSGDVTGEREDAGEREAGTGADGDAGKDTEKESAQEEGGDKDGNEQGQDTAGDQPTGTGDLGDLDPFDG